MAKLNVTVSYDDITIATKLDKQKAILNITDVVIAGDVSIPSLISTDPNNDLNLGSDNKLYVSDTNADVDIDYLAYYLLFKD